MADDLFGLLFLGYFALMVGVGVGVFARGATGMATLLVILLVILLGAPFVALLALGMSAAARGRCAA